MYRKSKVSAKKDTPEQQELQSLLLSMKSLQDNEYIDSVSRGKLWNPCENLLAITAKCEKVLSKHSGGPSDLIRDVCSESDNFTVGILNKLKPWYLLLCGQLIKAQFSGITRFFTKTLTRVLSKKHEYVLPYDKGQYIIHVYNASLCRLKIM